MGELEDSGAYQKRIHREQYSADIRYKMLATDSTYIFSRVIHGLYQHYLEHKFFHCIKSSRYKQTIMLYSKILISMVSKSLAYHILLLSLV